MEKWPYAELTKAAKDAGGPEAWLKLVKDAARDEGRDEGLRQGRKQGAFFTGALIVIVAAGYKILKKIFGSKEKIPEKEVEKAEKNLIKGINEYAESHSEE